MIESVPLLRSAKVARASLGSDSRLRMVLVGSESVMVLAGPTKTKLLGSALKLPPAAARTWMLSVAVPGVAGALILKVSPLVLYAAARVSASLPVYAAVRGLQDALPSLSSRSVGALLSPMPGQSEKVAVPRPSPVRTKVATMAAIWPRTTPCPAALTMSSVYWVSWLTGILSPQAMFPPVATLPVASQTLDGVRVTEVMDGWTPMVKLTLALLLVRSPAVTNVSVFSGRARMAGSSVVMGVSPPSSFQVAVTVPVVSNWTLPEMV